VNRAPGVKRPGREADHSPSSVEDKNGGAIPSHSYKSSWRIVLLITGTALNLTSVILICVVSGSMRVHSWKSHKKTERPETSKMYRGVLPTFGCGNVSKSSLLVRITCG
jgi:hypothetical protein